MQIFIRQIAPGDAAEVTALSHQLGYPLPVKQILQNINAILATSDHDVYVAMYDNRVIGWIGVCHTIMLESQPCCEINGLVVNEKYRGKGVGKLLIEKAKQWGKERGNDKLKLRCNVVRTETHLFYQHLGFKEVKQQINFEINI
jgi:GNAT superfamily N-acetyltransferase